MEPIQCSKCGQEIHEWVEFCPNCAEPIESYARPALSAWRMAAVILMIAALVSASGCAGTASSTSPPPDSVVPAVNALPAWNTAAEDDESELTIYPMATQVGTVARRVFRDDSGRICRTVYYDTPDFSILGPFSEESLRVQRTVLHEYDNEGRERRQRHYARDMTLNRIRDTIYEDGDRKLVWRRPDETREYEIHYSGRRSTSHLYFDLTGAKLVAIRGLVPSDMDLGWGWGEPIDGLVCGIGANRTKGRLEEIKVDVTLRNLTDAATHTVTGIQYHVLQMELRDAQGTVVSQDRDYIAERERYLLYANHGPNINLQTIPPREAGNYTGGYDLREWYSKLPAGTYDLTVRYRTAGGQFDLVSNTLELQIQE